MDEGGDKFGPGDTKKTEQRDRLSTRRAGKGRPRADKEQFVRSARNTGNIINSEQSY